MGLNAFMKFDKLDTGILAFLLDAHKQIREFGKK